MTLRRRDTGRQGRREVQPLQIQDVGELGLLERLRQFCPSRLIGDDAAVLAVPPDKRLVVTTDVLVDGVHFSDRTTTSEDVGWRATAANLSDLAAMGADPMAITVGLSLPGTVPVEWVAGLYRGMGQCLQRYGGQIAGGDLCRAPTISVAITAFGSVDAAQALYRSGAKPGQAIVATGRHGSSRAGLEVLLNPESAANVSALARKRWVSAHQRPHPRFDAINCLRRLLSTGASIAAMDTSDGLANGIVQLCQMSGVGAKVERSQLPIDPTLIAWRGEEEALDWALYGGEDFELLLCLPPAIALEFVQQLGGDAAVVGATIQAPEILLTDSKDASWVQPLTLDRGFQHF